jgi:hypothetical protein
MAQSRRRTDKSGSARDSSRVQKGQVRREIPSHSALSYSFLIIKQRKLFVPLRRLEKSIKLFPVAKFSVNISSPSRVDIS